MAKRRKPLIKLEDNSSVKPKVVPIKSGDGLPSYSRFFDTNKGVRFFFEPPRSSEEASYAFVSHIVKFCYAGEYSKGTAAISFYPKAKKIVGPFSDDIARLIIQYAKIKSGSSDSLTAINSGLNVFLDFIQDNSNINLSSFSEITQDLLISFGQYVQSNKLAYKSLGSVKRLFLINPFADMNKLNKVSFSKFTIDEDEDEDVKNTLYKLTDDGYSEKELMQILAYLFYELDVITSNLEKIKKAKESCLGDNNLPIEELKSNADKLIWMLTNGEEGYELLLDNIYKHHRANNREDNSIKNSYIDAIIYRVKRKAVNMEDELLKFFHYARKDTWTYRLKTADGELISGKDIQAMRFWNYLNGRDAQFTFCISLYIMITSGINFSVVKSWKRTTNGKPWYENFDKFLGSDEYAPSRDRSVLMVGRKNKTGIAAGKKIPTAIPIYSPLFKYLKAYDDAHDPDREYFLVTNEQSVNKRKNLQFCMANQITLDNGEIAERLYPKMFRKVFAGHKLLSLLGDVKSADELVYKLKESLNHDSFDTTLFSYIMKAGIGNRILDSAIVALTSDLLEKSLKFSGKIQEDSERNNEIKSVFLCDCTDPSNPTHDLPINHEHCRKYDLCLGCERSEVYAEHIPFICYRILQFERGMEKNYEMYRVSMEDRHAIALDTLARFRLEHLDGENLLIAAYEKANERFINNDPMLPSIIQTESL
jgi:hypothetical protein